MKLARLISNVSLLIVFLFAAAACSGVATSAAVQLPDELVIVLGFAVMTVVTGAFKWLGAQVGQDLSTQAKQVAAAISSVIVLGINYWLTLVPAAYDNGLSALFAFLIVFLGGTGLYNLWKSAR
jgi:hypothetical protein